PGRGRRRPDVPHRRVHPHPDGGTAGRADVAGAGHRWTRPRGLLERVPPDLCSTCPMRLCASASGRQHVLCCAHLPAANAGPLYNVFSRGIVGIKVIDPSEDSRVPFLRGILTRSLCQAGMRFSEAYTIANEVRNKLSSRSEISTEELT